MNPNLVNHNIIQLCISRNQMTMPQATKPPTRPQGAKPKFPATSHEPCYSQLKLTILTYTNPSQFPNFKRILSA